MPIKQNFNTEGITPDPDPSFLTTQNLLREIAGLRELLTQRVESIEKAVSVAHENLVRVPTDVDKAIGHLKEVVDEKFVTVGERFSSVQTQFQERDIRVEQTAKDSKVAVDAALQAAKEAVGEQNKSSALSIGKSEASTNKQIEQQAILIATTNAGILNMISDLKERQTRQEAQFMAAQTAMVTHQQVTQNEATSHQQSRSTSIAVASLVVVTVLSIIGMIITVILRWPK